MLLHPNVLTLFGAGAHERECNAPVQARARQVGSVSETKEQKSRRMGDIGIIGVLERDAIQLIDFTVSDGGGGSKTPLSHVAGSLCSAKAAEKHATYRGENGRFVGIAKGQFMVPSFDQMGGCTEETEKWVLQIVNAVAAANPGTLWAVINRRVWGAVSTALMRSIGTNALEFRNGKLLATSECVGGSRSQAAKPQAASGGSKRGRQRRTGTGSAAGGPQRAVQEQLEDGKSDVSMSPNAASVAGGSQPGRTSD